jgi:hypothetical protein
VVVDGRSQILKIPPRSTGRTAFPGVIPTCLARDFREHPSAPKIIEPAEPSVQLRSIDLPLSAIVTENQKHVGDVDCSDIPFSAGGLIFLGKVSG